jgi:hypothetical protein
LFTLLCSLSSSAVVSCRVLLVAAARSGLLRPAPARLVRAARPCAQSLCRGEQAAASASINISSSLTAVCVALLPC